MLASWLFLVGSLIGLWFTKQALRPVPLPKVRSLPSFFAGWLTNELIFHHFVWQALLSAMFVFVFDALQHPVGWVALGITATQWLLMLLLVRDALATKPIFEDALLAELGADYREVLPDTGEPYDHVAWRSLVIPFRIRHPEVEHRGRIQFARVAARDLELDVYAPRERTVRRSPLLVYVHGGGWILGYRDRQGLPLMHEMAARGWVGMNPGYRLSPWATFPDHLVDVKRAIAWAREHAEELGADPSFVAVAGGSAGGHLATLAALTGDRTDLQPGFEDADCSVQACISFYGVYDFTNRFGNHTEEMMEHLERNVMKAAFDEDPDRYRLASPFDQIRPDAPPFLVIHGERDSFISFDEAQRFAEELRKVSRSPVVDVGLPGAQHAFDIFPSPRAAITLRGVARFLEFAHARHLAGRQSAATPAVSAAGDGHPGDD